MVKLKASGVLICALEVYLSTAVSAGQLHSAREHQQAARSNVSSMIEPAYGPMSKQKVRPERESMAQQCAMLQAMAETDREAGRSESIAALVSTSSTVPVVVAMTHSIKTD